MKLVILVLTLLGSGSAFGQKKIRQYVAAHTVPMASIDLDAADDSALAAFGNAVGDARFVLLGEQSHGDATAFRAKARLVKYLHEKKGFNVLAFESDFFALNQGWKNLPKQKGAIDSFLRKNIFQIWAECPSAAEFFYTYIPGTHVTSSPLQVSGFDPQVHGDYSAAHLMSSLDSFLKSLSVTGAELPALSADLALLSDSLLVQRQARSSVTIERLKDILSRINEKLSQLAAIDPFWKQVLRSLLVEIKEIEAEAKQDAASYYVRDRQMAENLAWLSDHEYPQEKIIVWAHNYHVSKNSMDHFDMKSSNRSMGHYLVTEQDKGGQVYILGLTSNYGRSSWVTNAQWSMEVKRSVKNAFEGWLPESYRYSFTDFVPFRKANPGLTEPFYMKGSLVISHKEELFRWTDIFDGVFYIRQMEGCR